MYTAQFVIDRVQSLIRERGLKQKIVLLECGINENTLIRMTDNKGISSFYLAKIADYLGCSVDYLLGRTDNPNSHKEQSKNTVSGNYNAVDNSSVNVGTVAMKPQAEALLETFNNLTPLEQAKVLVYADELNSNK